jgi:hypothetical protein
MPLDSEPTNPALVADVRGWILKARKDLGAADYEMLAIPPFAEDVLFHSQQATEKTLKAFLSWHCVPFRKTHNLVELGEACCLIDVGSYSGARLLSRSMPGSSGIRAIPKKRPLPRQPLHWRRRTKCSMR